MRQSFSVTARARLAHPKIIRTQDIASTGLFGASKGATARPPRGSNCLKSIAINASASYRYSMAQQNRGSSSFLLLFTCTHAMNERHKKSHYQGDNKPRRPPKVSVSANGVVSLCGSVLGVTTIWHRVSFHLRQRRHLFVTWPVAQGTKFVQRTHTYFFITRWCLNLA